MSALDWQQFIYLNGFSGKRPYVPVDMQLLEQVAARYMSKQAYAYVAGGAGHGQGMLNNRNAFDQWKISPRMLRDVSERDTSIELLDRKLPTPFLLAPIGVLEMANKEADLAVARAAANLGIPYIFSNQASVPMESASAVMGDQPRWFQLYWSKSDALVASFLRRAEACGCDAIVLTLDTTMLGWRTRDLDVAYLPFLEGKGIAQYTSDPVFQEMIKEALKNDSSPKQKFSLQLLPALVQMVKNYPGGSFISKLRSGRPMAAVRLFTSTYSNPAINWQRLRSLREHTKLPILLKGILHPDDAKKVIDYGIDGIIVSNHGGRQVDGAIGTIDALPGIVDAVRGRMPILLDSGIRGGADAFKALALGATAVCIGRPYVYGLALAGQEGVNEVLRNFMADFELTMGLAGCKNISEIKKEMLVR